MPCVRFTVPLRTVTGWTKLLLTTTLPSIKIMLPSSLPVSKVYEPVVWALKSPVNTASKFVAFVELYGEGKADPVVPKSKLLLSEVVDDNAVTAGVCPAKLLLSAVGVANVLLEGPRFCYFPCLPPPPPS